jgi:hypothetical protein
MELDGRIYFLPFEVFVFYLWKYLGFTCGTFSFSSGSIYFCPPYRKEKAMKRLGLMFPGSTLDVSSIMTIGRQTQRERLYLKGLCQEMNISFGGL